MFLQNLILDEVDDKTKGISTSSDQKKMFELVCPELVGKTQHIYEYYHNHTLNSS